jgi:hypothetical protein
VNDEQIDGHRSAPHTEPADHPASLDEDRVDEDRVDEDRVDEDRVDEDRVDEDRVDEDRVDEDGVEAVDQPVERPRPSPYRQPAFAVLRAVVVLAAAVVGYQAVIPSTHVIRSRLARLAVSEPGVAGFNVKPTQAGEQAAAQTQLATVVAAAKKAPSATGVYSIEWAPSTSEGAGLVVFLLPTTSEATSTFSEVRTQQLAAASESANGLTRRSTFAVSSVPGSAGAVFTSSAGGSAATELAATALRYGRVVAVTEALSSTRSQADASVLTAAEYSRLRKVASGFSLKVVDRPVVATVVWAAGAVALALVVALGPVARRRSARRRQRLIEEELSRQVVVRGQIITKRRL